MFAVAQDSNVDVTQYVFHINFNSSQTGFFQVPYGDKECRPSEDFGDRFTNWVRGPELHTQVIRCGLGDNQNSGFVVRAKLSTAPPESQGFVVHTTGHIPQAWHQLNHAVTYRLDLSTFAGERPSYVKESYYTSEMQEFVERHIKYAAFRWNHAVGQVGPTAFTRDSANPDVIVRGFWQGYTQACIRGRFACVEPIDGNYPHLNDMTFWLRFPPKGQVTFTGLPSYYTEDAADLEKEFGYYTYVYLPNVALHELGHFTGLYHLPFGHVMYNAPSDDPDLELSESDVNGMTESIGRHQHRGR